MDQLLRVEDELVLLLKDAERLVSALRDLPAEEKQAQDACSSLFSHLNKAQAGILENVEHLKDYLPFERDAAQSRIRMHQARSDRVAAKSSLEITLDQFTEQLATNEEEDEEEDEEDYTPPGKGIKRARREY